MEPWSSFRLPARSPLARVVAVALEKLEDAPLEHLGAAGAVGLPQQGEQGAGEAAARLQLVFEEVGQALLVHAQHLQQLGHVHGHALPHAGGDHRPLVGPQHLAHGLGQARRLAQPLEKCQEIGVVAQGAFAAGGVAAVLALGAVVRTADTGGIGCVLHPRIVGYGGHVPVDIRVVMAGNRICHTKQIWHVRPSLSIKVI